MNRFSSLAYRLLGPLAERGTAKEHEDLQNKLLRSDWPIRAAAYRATLWLATALGGALGLIVGTAIALVASHLHMAIRISLPVACAASLAGIVIGIAPIIRRNAASERQKEIDENLPHGLNYMLTLASAGLPPRDVWASLARAEVFGALAIEAERIVRDLDVFGYDLLRALRQAHDRTPSKRFQEFLVGAISAFQSGVELENYLRHRGEQYEREAVEEQLRTLDTMGLMAEAFLVVVVAAPLFLIILLTVMSITQGRVVLTWGFAMALVFIPLMQIIVGALVRSMNPKVWT